MSAEIARRAVAAPGWRWLRGMRFTWPEVPEPHTLWEFRVTSSRADGTEIIAAEEVTHEAFRWCRCSDGWRVWRFEFETADELEGFRPGVITRHPGPAAWTVDLSDPATLGCLQWLAREAWKPVGVLYVRPPIAASHGEPWDVYVVDYLGGQVWDASAESEAEALVAALEARP